MKDVTSQEFRDVAENLIETEEYYEFFYKGKRYKLAVEELEPCD